MKHNRLMYALVLACLSAATASAGADDKVDRSRDRGDSMSRDESTSTYDRDSDRDSTALSDSAITAKVRAALLAEPSLKSTGIKIDTFGGVVQLSGFVPSRDDVDRAVSAAREVDDVRAVKNDLRVR